MVSRSSHWCLSHIDRKKSTGDQHLKCSFEGVDVFLSTSVQDLRVVQSITIWLQLCPLPSCLCYHCIPCHWGELWCCKHTSGHGTCKPQIGTQHSTKAPSRHKLWKKCLKNKRSAMPVSKQCQTQKTQFCFFVSWLWRPPYSEANHFESQQEVVKKTSWINIEWPEIW